MLKVPVRATQFNSIHDLVGEGGWQSERLSIFLHTSDHPFPSGVPTVANRCGGSQKAGGAFHNSRFSTLHRVISGFENTRTTLSLSPQMFNDLRNECWIGKWIVSSRNGTLRGGIRQPYVGKPSTVDESGSDAHEPAELFATPRRCSARPAAPGSAKGPCSTGTNRIPPFGTDALSHSGAPESES